jgi:ribose 5-phosphate isomerase B
MEQKTVYIGADHAGFDLKQHLKKSLKAKGYVVHDLGNTTYDPTDDYPDFGAKVAKAVAKHRARGILCCGSAEGICIVANKIKGIRAVAVWGVANAKLSREHNDANVLCLSGWQLPKKRAERIVLTWLKTPFSRAARHLRRLKKISALER